MDLCLKYWWAFPIEKYFPFSIFLSSYFLTHPPVDYFLNFSRCILGSARKTSVRISHRGRSQCTFHFIKRLLRYISHSTYFPLFQHSISFVIQFSFSQSVPLSILKIAFKLSITTNTVTIFVITTPTTTTTIIIILIIITQVSGGNLTDEEVCGKLADSWLEERFTSQEGLQVKKGVDYGAAALNFFQRGAIKKRICDQSWACGPTYELLPPHNSFESVSLYIFPHYYFSQEVQESCWPQWEGVVCVPSSRVGHQVFFNSW